MSTFPQVGPFHSIMALLAAHSLHQWFSPHMGYIFLQSLISALFISPMIYQLYLVVWREYICCEAGNIVWQNQESNLQEKYRGTL